MFLVLCMTIDDDKKGEGDIIMYNGTYGDRPRQTCCLYWVGSERRRRQAEHFWFPMLSRLSDGFGVTAIQTKEATCTKID